MPAARLLPGSTQSAAEPTTGTTAAAASADTDANGRVCGVGGVGACPLLRAATARRHRSTSGLLVRTNCVHRAHHVQRGACDGHGLLIAALTALVRAPFGRGSEGLRYLPCGAVAADLEQMAQPEASQRLWFRYKPLGYCQARLNLRRSQRQERLPPLHAPIPTNMVVSASVASVLVRFARCYSRRHRSTSGLLVRTNCVHRVHHVQRGARDGQWPVSTGQWTHSLLHERHVTALARVGC